MQRTVQCGIAPAVAGSVDALDTGAVLALVRLDVAAAVLLHPQLLQHGLLWPQEAHGEHHDLTGVQLLAVRHLGHLPPPRLVLDRHGWSTVKWPSLLRQVRWDIPYLGPLYEHRLHPGHPAVAVVQETLAHRVVPGEGLEEGETASGSPPGVPSPLHVDLLVAVVHLEEPGQERAVLCGAEWCGYLGYCGQGLSGARELGGWGRISKVVILLKGVFA